MTAPAKLRKELMHTWPTGGLVRLENASNGTDDFDFFVSNPPLPGVQPVLGVRRHDVEADYGDIVSLPKRLRMAAKSEKLSGKFGTPLTLEEVELRFWDAVIVLPKEFPTAGIVRERSHLIGFAIVAAVYRNFTESLKKRPEILNGYERESIFSEPYIQQSQVSVALGSKRSVASKTLPNILRVLACLRTWRLWHLRADEAIHHEKWKHEWTVLERWNRWERLGFTWPERVEELKAFRRWGQDPCEELQGICERLGL